MGNSIVYANEINSQKPYEKRENLKIIEESFLKGKYKAIYEYTEGDTHYKRIDEADDEFKETKSELFELVRGKYVKVETQYTNIDDKGIMNVYIDSEKGNDKNWQVNLKDNLEINNNAIVPYVNNYDWITEETDGYKYIGNLGRTALISAIAAIAGSIIGGPLGAGVGASAAAIADALFNGGNNYVYYHKIYNWKYCERDWRIIEETEYTRFYEDSYHRFFIDYTYVEWRC
ncbi:hypothetical protein HKO22_03380 [Peptoniphilus sp. AGMB00490]|uniref:Uncharacterized protein n=2 Tax=Peptoniphilus TaxID=162289 RepID=A0A848RFJ5_9FIRM|nr:MULTISPECIES: hypothetical protein [Peptoniphilus]NMW84785.1 hypothetical protein [Peptoniphilus faecalis]